MNPRKLFGTPNDREDFGGVCVETAEEVIDSIDELSD